MVIERVRARLSRETEPRVPRARAFPAMIRTSRFTLATHPPVQMRGQTRAQTRGARRARGAARRGFAPGGAFFLAAARTRPPILPRD